MNQGALLPQSPFRALIIIIYITIIIIINNFHIAEIHRPSIC